MILVGKFGQRRNLPQTALCFDHSSICKIANRDDIEIVNEIEIGDYGLQISYVFKDVEHAPAGQTSYQLVSFVTSYARVMLYEAMDQIETKGGGKRVLYYDTDSIVFIERDGEQLIETGETLGSLTDEVLAATKDPNAYICRAGFTAPKSYYLIYKLSNGDEIPLIKAKGISLHSEASKMVNEKTMNELIKNFRTTGRQEYSVPQNIIYSTAKNWIITHETVKKFRVVTGKRSMNADGTSVPYGYKRTGDVGASTSRTGVRNDDDVEEDVVRGKQARLVAYSDSSDGGDEM